MKREKVLRRLATALVLAAVLVGLASLLVAIATSAQELVFTTAPHFDDEFHSPRQIVWAKVSVQELRESLDRATSCSVDCESIRQRVSQDVQTLAQMVGLLSPLGSPIDDLWDSVSAVEENLYRGVSGDLTLFTGGVVVRFRDPSRSEELLTGLGIGPSDRRRVGGSNFWLVRTGLNAEGSVRLAETLISHGCEPSKPPDRCLVVSAVPDRIDPGFGRR